MRAKLVQIGNSRGVRIPKGMIEEAELGDEVELSVRKGEIVIARVKKVREGWAEDAKHMAQHQTDLVWADEYEDPGSDLPDEEWPELGK